MRDTKTSLHFRIPCFHIILSIIIVGSRVVSLIL